MVAVLSKKFEKTTFSCLLFFCNTTKLVFISNIIFVFIKNNSRLATFENLDVHQQREFIYDDNIVYRNVMTAPVLIKETSIGLSL